MKCLDCDTELSGKRVDARFCNDTCKKRWQRKQKPAGKRGRPKKSPPITQNPSGLPGGPSSTPSPSVPDQGPDVPPVPTQIVITDLKMKVDLNTEAEHFRANLKEAGLLDRFENPPIEDYIPKLEPFP